MILRFVFGLTTLATTFVIYFVVMSVGATPDPLITEHNGEKFAQDWQTTLCTPSDELLGELLWLDPQDSLPVTELEDEAFSWGLLSPNTAVFVDYVPQLDSNSQYVASATNLCEGNFFMVDHGADDYSQPNQCPHHLLQKIGQAQ
jgi:hypothetical protein